MDFTFRALEPALFPRKDYKQASQKSIWKKYKPSISEQFPSAVRSLSYAQNLLAVASKTLVRIYDTLRYRTDDQDNYLDQPKSIKLREVINCVEFRNDAKMLLIGDKGGNISLVPKSNSLKVIQVYPGKHPVSTLQLNPSQGTQFVMADNDRNLRVWMLDDSRQPLHSIEAAHSDYIRDIKFESKDVFFSASHDRSIKRWDLRENPFSSSSLIYNNSQPFESICLIPDSTLLATASGREVKLWDLRNMGEVLSSKEPHSKTISKLAFLQSRERLLSAGQDGMLRILKINRDTSNLQTIYSIKFGTELLALDTGKDEIAIGGYNGGLWGLRKTAENQKGVKLNDLEEEDKLFKSIRIERPPQHLPRDYKYFNRGVHSKRSEVTDDVVMISAFTGKHQSAVNKHLQKFEYKSVLDLILIKKKANISEIIPLVEELEIRGALDIALKGRGPQEIAALLDTIDWKIKDERYSETMAKLVNRILSLYSAAVVTNEKVWRKITKIKEYLESEQSSLANLLALQGQIETIEFISSTQV